MLFFLFCLCLAAQAVVIRDVYDVNIREPASDLLPSLVAANSRQNRNKLKLDQHLKHGKAPSALPTRVFITKERMVEVFYR